MIKPFVGSYPITQGFSGKHKAIDFGLPCGTEVRAAEGDLVVFARFGWNRGYGNEIAIRRGARETRYCHLSEIYVSEGQWVKETQIIGKSGRSGFVIPIFGKGCHLHFEVFDNGLLRNPLEYFDTTSPTPPATPTIEVRYYTVIRGDTLSIIAKKYYGNANLWPKIYNANRDKIKNANLIYPGQNLRIP